MLRRHDWTSSKIACVLATLAIFSASLVSPASASDVPARVIVVPNGSTVFAGSFGIVDLEGHSIAFDLEAWTDGEGSHLIVARNTGFGNISQFFELNGEAVDLTVETDMTSARLVADVPGIGLFDITLSLGGWVNSATTNRSGCGSTHGQYEFYSLSHHLAYEGLISVAGTIAGRPLGFSCRTYGYEAFGYSYHTPTRQVIP